MRSVLEAAIVLGVFGAVSRLDESIADGFCMGRWNNVDP